MGNIFPPWLNRLPLAVALGATLAGMLAVGGVYYYFSPKYTDVGYSPVQPLPFEHKQHAGTLGMDCRYCHNTAEVAARAAVPPAATCMNCHQVVKPDSRKLALLREAFAADRPLAWIRVHMLPDYVYFDHSVHLAANVGCKSCHGRVDQMRVVSQQEPLSMGWCLDCHHDPGPHLRPAGVAVTDMSWEPQPQQHEKVAANGRTVKPPIHCSGCHR